MMPSVNLRMIEIQIKPIEEAARFKLMVERAQGNVTSQKEGWLVHQDFHEINIYKLIKCEDG